MTDQEQIEEMAKAIKPILENRTDICFIPDLDKPIAKELLKHYQPKLPKDSVVLSKGAYESLSTKAKVVNAIEIRKKTAEKIYLQAKAIVDTTKHIVQDREYIHIDALKEIIKNCGVEIKE